MRTTSLWDLVPGHIQEYGWPNMLLNIGVCASDAEDREEVIGRFLFSLWGMWYFDEKLAPKWRKLRNESLNEKAEMHWSVIVPVMDWLQERYSLENYPFKSLRKDSHSKTSGIFFFSKWHQRSMLSKKKWCFLKLYLMRLWSPLPHSPGFLRYVCVPKRTPVVKGSESSQREHVSLFQNEI